MSFFKKLSIWASGLAGLFFLASLTAILIYVIQIREIVGPYDNGQTFVREVLTEKGYVRGQRATTLFDQRVYYGFKGIPYAQPPVDQLRFKPPISANSWSGSREAFEYGSECIQPSGGNEDCLFINVFAPADFTPQSKFPVIFAIHGGGFFGGSGENFAPDFLLNAADGGIVIVTFNYRMGPLGFLSLRTPEFSGNMGLKDQLLALKWTSENIHNFGGDKHRITVYGLSAGSTAAHMHVLSPASNRLFQRAIMSSGSALNPWTITYKNHAETLRKMASDNGVSINSDGDLVNYLKTVNVTELFEVAPVNLDTERKLSDLYWVPVVEPEGTDQPFFSSSPAEILNEHFTSVVDTLFGYVSNEGYIFLDSEFRNPELLEPMNQLLEIELPLENLNKNVSFASDTYRSMADKIRNYYFSGKPIDNNTLYEYCELWSDVSFNYGIDRAVRLHAAYSTGKTYYFRFSVDGALNFGKAVTKAKELGFAGATHADDIYYTFGYPDGKNRPVYEQLPKNSMELQVIRDFSQLYANFVIYGNPTPSQVPIYFEPVRRNTLNFADIRNDGIQVGTDPVYNSSLFWDTLLAEYDLVVPIHV